MPSNIAAVILAAGQGTRMRSTLPKVLHPLAGKPMIQHILDMLDEIEPDRTVVVVSPMGEEVTAAVAPVKTVIQHRPMGTADALMAAVDLLTDYDGDVVVLFGDTPLIRADTIRRLIAKRRETDAAVAILAMHAPVPNAYGRVITNGDAVERIVEWRDASEEERDVTLCNSGVMALDGEHLFYLLSMIENKNSKGEFYLTDIVGIAGRYGARSVFIEGASEELVGINSPEELAQVEEMLLQQSVG